MHTNSIESSCVTDVAHKNSKTIIFFFNFIHEKLKVRKFQIKHLWHNREDMILNIICPKQILTMNICAVILN